MMATGHTLRMRRSFSAPAQAVFDAWTSAEVMRRWWHAEHHWETTEAIVDLRVGGAVRVVMRNPDDGTEYGGGGEYTEIDESTIVHFTHSGLRDEEAVDSHEDGWSNAFDNLERALGPTEP
jgi:uncharacterized protein YndB with AHSA1/START domain